VEPGYEVARQPPEQLLTSQNLTPIDLEPAAWSTFSLLSAAAPGGPEPTLLALPQASCDCHCS
jgi:hypothetical protein